MLLKIVQAGEPVLRRVARPLTEAEILSPGLQNLVALMRATMRDAPGVGLAAPQIGEALQLAVIEDRAEYLDGMPAEWLAERKRQAVPFHVIINPKLTVLDETAADFHEGCLSVAGFSALVPRALAVRVEALDERAQPVTIEARGWYARILQHEIDHLHGRLYIDRMDSRTFATADNHQRYWAGMSADEVRAALAGEPRK
jgi:peptide deformylase